MIARAHVRSIFELPKMRNDSGKDFRNLNEGKEEHRLSLQVWGLPAERYDLLLSFFIAKGPDIETRRQWHKHTITKCIH